MLSMFTCWKAIYFHRLNIVFKCPHLVLVASSDFSCVFLVQLLSLFIQILPRHFIDKATPKNQLPVCTTVGVMKPKIKGVFLSVQDRRRHQKFKSKHFSTQNVSCLTSIEKIFHCISNAANIRQTQFKLRALAGLKSDIFGFCKQRCSKQSPCPSSILLPVDQLMTPSLSLQSQLNQFISVPYIKNEQIFYIIGHHN